MIDTVFPDFIAPEKFGRDHWQTFAYVEAVCVDGNRLGKKGVLDPEKMRCNGRRHRTFANAACWFASGKEYPTRLKGGELPKHDDWDCLQDLEAAGLLRILDAEVYVPRKHRLAVSLGHTEGTGSFGGQTCRVELTPEGWQAAGSLREHRAAGGRYDDFEPGLAQGEGLGR